MKLKILAVLILLFPVIAWADPPCILMGEYTIDGAIRTSGGIICSIVIITDGTDEVNVIIYDNASAASGTKVINWTVPAGERYGGYDYRPNGYVYRKGLYMDITDTGSAIVAVRIEVPTNP